MLIVLSLVTMCQNWYNKCHAEDSNLKNKLRNGRQEDNRKLMFFKKDY